MVEFVAVINKLHNARRAAPLVLLVAWLALIAILTEQVVADGSVGRGGPVQWGWRGGHCGQVVVERLVEMKRKWMGRRGGQGPLGVVVMVVVVVVRMLRVVRMVVVVVVVVVVAVVVVAVVVVVVMGAVVHRLGRGGPITLAAILEPVAHLGGRQAGRVGELALLLRIRILILEVPLAQEGPGSLLEAVGLLLAVPDGPRQGKLLPDPVLVDGAQRAAPQALGLEVVGLEPEVLELGVVALGEAVRLDDGVHLLEVAAVVGHPGLLVEELLVLVANRWRLARLLLALGAGGGR